MTENHVHEGGCACGSVRFRTHGEPSRAGVCHCRYCQTRTGSAFGVSAYFPAEKVDLLSGELRDYSFQTESGRPFTTRFCTTCGTTVFWTVGALPGLVGIAAGTFDPPTFWFALQRESFTRSAAPFVHIDAPEHLETTASYKPVNPENAALSGGRHG